MLMELHCKSSPPPVHLPVNRNRSRWIQEPNTRRLESVLEVAKTTATDSIETALDQTALVVECTDECCHSHDSNQRRFVENDQRHCANGTVVPGDISFSTFSEEESRVTQELPTSSDEPQGDAHGACSRSLSSHPESVLSTGCGGNGLTADFSESEHTTADTAKLVRCWPESSQPGGYLDDGCVELLRIDGCSRWFRRLSRWMVSDEVEDAAGKTMNSSPNVFSHGARIRSRSDKTSSSKAPQRRRCSRKKTRYHCLWCSRSNTNTPLRPRSNSTDDDGIGNNHKSTAPESTLHVSGGRRQFRQQHQHQRDDNCTTDGAFRADGTATMVGCATPIRAYIWPYGGRGRSRGKSGISSSNNSSRGINRRRPHSAGAFRNISINSAVRSTYHYEHDEGDIGEREVRRPVGPAYASAVAPADTEVAFLEGTSDLGQERAASSDKESPTHPAQQDYRKGSLTEETSPASHMMSAGEDPGFKHIVNDIEVAATGRVRKRPEALFCSWDCASRWNERFSPPQLRHERRVRIDIAAGRIVR